ncbi:MAG: PTS IIA-like nitrogen regulatory protein PtsN [Hyphomicrobiales bacterium]|jgi:PTS system nitrogen regulatory IIA component|nr:PTS IIA-like nitrogen regulatory protein PtsN [Hyphomicrobiales bacterium]
MLLHDLLTPDSIISPLKANGKKQALQDIAQRAAAITGLSEREIFETLLQRERLGSTGIGDGIAIPHGRSARLDRLRGLFVRLEKPIDFEALDGQPVDILFVLLAPEGAGADHLKALARVARVLRDRSTLERIRRAHDASAVFAILTESTAKAA